MTYDEAPIRVHTAYTVEEVRRFQRFNARFLRYISVALLLLMLVSFSTILMRGNSEFSSLTLPLVMFSAFLMMFLASTGLFYTQREHVKATASLRNGQNFIFRQTDFIAEISQPDRMGQNAALYSTLFSVHETKDMFYIFIAQRQAYLVSKQGFITGTPDMLRALLQSALPPDKYHIHR